MLAKNKTQNEIDIFKNVPNIMDMIMPDVLQEKSNYLILGYNKYSRTFVMTVYPEQTWIGWFNDLFYIGNINISVKIEPTQNGTVINQLSKKFVQSQSEYATYSRQGNVLHLPELEKQINDLEDLRMLIQTNQDKLFFVTVFITLNAESLDELNEKTKILESELNKKTTMIRTLTFRQVDGLKTVLPIGEIPIPNFERNMVAGGVATLIPIANPNLSHDKGIFIGRNIYTNAPVYIDTFIGPPILPNPHVFICGTSGGGKSVALKILTIRNTNDVNSLYEKKGGKLSNYNVPLFIGSQFIDEFLASDEGKAIINICSTRYLFKQSPGSVDDVANFFNLSEGTKNFLTNAK